MKDIRRRFPSPVPDHNRILITGGTGTFGQAMTRQIIESTDAHVVILSRDELKQHRMLQEFGHTDRDRLHMFLGDVRDLQRLRRAFEGVDAVIHAAALKRIEVGAMNPNEMVKTNVLGTMNVIEAAHDCGVDRVVALSTDKAFQPQSPYGASKALLEAMVLAANNTRGRDGPIYSVSRYGNIAGSNGSVIPMWRQMIAAGKTIQVTDPDCTRFWMDISEATALVWDMLIDMKGGELVIPPHLPAYRVMDLAVAMTDNGRLADVEITGLPKWEKKHESMDHGYSSETARRMTVEELKSRLEGVQ